MDKESKKDRIILVTNDDGIEANGLKALIKVVKEFGRVLVVAPFEGQSGMSHAITVKHPIRIEKIREEPDMMLYGCSGTPVDCVKLAINEILDTKPDLLVSGINHGSNSSASILYSGTMAAAIEGCINHIPSIGFSLLDYSKNAHFDSILRYIKKILENLIMNSIPKDTCLNVNIPVNKVKVINGIKICRQVKGLWKEEFDKRKDPLNREYYWLTGRFHNLEPKAEDTDEWALKNNYISIVPIKIDLTDYTAIDLLKKWEL